MHLWIITVYQRFQDIKTYIELYSKITVVYNDIFIITSFFSFLEQADKSEL